METVSIDIDGWSFPTRKANVEALLDYLVEHQNATKKMIQKVKDVSVHFSKTNNGRILVTVIMKNEVMIDFHLQADAVDEDEDEDEEDEDWA